MKKRRKPRPRRKKGEYPSFPPKESTLDAAFSKYVKERDGYVCQICKTDFSHDHSGVECSHHVGRRKRSVRWEPDNASTKCLKCHREADLNPLLHADWIKLWLGEERYEALKEKSGQLGKRTPQEKWELLDQLNQMRKEL